VCRRITIVFDLNGVLIRAKADAERAAGVPHPFDPRPGLRHLLSLWPHFRLALFTSATAATVQRRLADLDALLWADQLRAVRVLAPRTAVVRHDCSCAQIRRN
jgi:hypothetical protein